MGVTIKSTNNIPRMKRLLAELEKKEIKAGVFGHDSNVDEEDINLVTLARVHEFGMTIKPKNAKFLTIPLIPAAKGKRAAEFPDLFFYKPDGEKFGFLARKVGKKERVQNVFLLVPSVTIPERSFLRAGFDENVDKIMDKIERELQKVLEYKINPDVFADMVGLEFAGLIKKYMRNLRTPPNSKITSTVKRSTNPLMDTGRLVGSIRHEVE